MCSDHRSSINGRPVLHPNCNRIPLLDRRNNTLINPAIIQTTKKPNSATTSTRINNDHVHNTPKSPTSRSKSLMRSKSLDPNTLQCNFSSGSIVVESPGSIAAARREHVATLQVQRKMRIAHYGRTSKPATTGDCHHSSLLATNNNNNNSSHSQQGKRCSFITPNSDPIYVAYHDEEWGVPVHDDKLLFELLVLTGAQVGSDWSSVLRKREDFREAFAGFDAKIISKFSEKKMSSISGDYGIELSQIRGVVDNSIRILEIKTEFGSFAKYLWGFVNHKPLATQYKLCQKIPAKTSKSETISKDMVRRGFRLVGPTVVHSFMQAAGLTNDHLITCPRHAQCTNDAACGTLPSYDLI